MTRARTVLFVSNHGDVVGGGEVSLLTLLKGLDRARWAPVVVVPSDGAVAERCRTLGLPTHVIPLPGLRCPGPAVVRGGLALRRLVRAAGAALLHANGSRAMLYAGLAGRLAGRPVIWHLRIAEPDPLLDWMLSRLASRIIATSDAVRARVRRWPEAYARSSVVPNGIDLEAFVPAKDPASVRDALGLGPGARVVGSVGRLVRFKGHRYLLSAFARLRERYPESGLVIVGDGPERSRLEADARALGIAGDVRFTGHREDVADLLAIMDVFVLPSLGEHFGRVLLEAMALERPVVATAAGGVPEIVEDRVTGLLVAPADAGALAEAVAALLADPVRARDLGRAGRRRVAERYPLARHAAEVEAVYEEVLREPA